jgi:signal transduction histidine kinase
MFGLFGAAGLITIVIYCVLGLFEFSAPLFRNKIALILAMSLSCIGIGVGITAATQRIWFYRVTKISGAMREIARGNYKIRVTENDKKEKITELGDLERTFNQMSSELDGIEMFRNDFINNFSHEFKTPIVSIRGFARRLQLDNLSDEQRKEYLDIIVKESERLSTMAQNVLLLTKLENQSIVSEKTEFYLDEQIRGAILLLEKLWEEKNIELDLELDEIKYVFNEEMLSHVWINLLSNAVKFTPEGGSIACTLKECDGQIVFTVKDSGCGMSEKVMERIFEKFYQGDDSHATAGNGIGLNIVKRILALANGDITVESKPGEGSTFTVILP